MSNVMQGRRDRRLFSSSVGCLFISHAQTLDPILSKSHRAYSPNLPGCSFAHVSSERSYVYTLHNIAGTIDRYVEVLLLSRFAICIFDQGPPICLGLTLRRPKAASAIITQNGFAYEEGFDPDIWARRQSYWNNDSAGKRNANGDQVLSLAISEFQ